MARTVVTRHLVRILTTTHDITALEFTSYALQVRPGHFVIVQCGCRYQYVRKAFCILAYRAASTITRCKCALNVCSGSRACMHACVAVVDVP